MGLLLFRSCSAWSPFSFNQYFSSLKLQRKQLLEKHWETIGSRRGPFLQKPDVCSSVSSKSGLRVNFLAVICTRAASTSCCILEHENHYFNPSLADINRMNKCFCSLLNLDGFILWKQVNIHLSSPPDNKRQRELTLPSLFLPPTVGEFLSSVLSSYIRC